MLNFGLGEGGGVFVGYYGDALVPVVALGVHDDGEEFVAEDYAGVVSQVDAVLFVEGLGEDFLEVDFKAVVGEVDFFAFEWGAAFYEFDVGEVVFALIDGSVG